LSAQLGFKLFCYPVRSKIKNHHAKFLDPARDFTFELEGNVIQVYRWGNGQKKIMFLHGWQSHTYRWKKYIESISTDEYTMYALDAPGHGQSSGSFFTVPLYSHTIHHLIKTIGAIDTVVGHSIGGFSILHLLYHEKELPVDKLVIMAAPGEANDFFSFYKNMLGLSEKTGNLIQRRFEKVIQNKIEFYSSGRFAAIMTKPGLIIHDQLDDEAMYQYAVKMNNVWNNSKLITTRNLGHNLKSASVVKHVSDFITVDHKAYSTTQLETV
jgi:predicted alpha/beta hydrolase family esterase